MTACKDCKHCKEIHTADRTYLPRADQFVCLATQLKSDFVFYTGKQNIVYEKCYKINKGNCPKFEEAK